MDGKPCGTAISVGGKEKQPSGFFMHFDIVNTIDKIEPF
jgi:hypothetical protein